MYFIIKYDDYISKIILKIPGVNADLSRHHSAVCGFKNRCTAGNRTRVAIMAMGMTILPSA